MFAEKYYKVKEHNASGASFTLAMNKFADMNDYEYSMMLGYKSTGVEGTYTPKVKSTPSSIDWTTKGAVTGVKN